MKRTEDYYRGLLLLKQDWNAEKNEAAIAMIKIRLNMTTSYRKKHGMTDNLTTIKSTARKSPSQKRSSAKGFCKQLFNG